MRQCTTVPYMQRTRVFERLSYLDVAPKVRQPARTILSCKCAFLEALMSA